MVFDVCKNVDCWQSGNSLTTPGPRITLEIGPNISFETTSNNESEKHRKESSENTFNQYRTARDI